MTAQTFFSQARISLSKVVFALRTPTNSFSVLGVEMYTPSTSRNPLGGHLGAGEGIGLEIFRGFFLVTFFFVTFFFVTFFFDFASDEGEAFGVGLLDAYA